MKALRRVLALVLLSCFALVPTTVTVRAADVIVFDGDSYAAIAYSPSTGAYGYGYNYGSRWSAEAAALRNCKADDARIVTWVNNGFCALAVGDDKSCWGVGWEYGDGATNTAAMRRALQEANKRTTNCRILLCVCSANVAPYVP
jgi:serine/threonine-protein kinase